MQILSTTGGTINFILREDISGSKTYSLKITSENKNKVIFTDSDARFSAGFGGSFYDTYVISQALVEGAFYMVEIQNTTDNRIIFRDKIFCTNQASSTYEMTSGIYTQHNTGDNEYKYYTAP
jgi:hypothetical protein